MANCIVVDDNKFIVNTLKEFLVEEGHEVIATGADGDEGVQLYQDHRPDVMFLDITMPNKDGRECLNEVIAYDDNAKIIIVSVIKEKDVIMECLTAGAKGFIEKPLKFKDDEFRKEFRSILSNALEE